MNALTFEQLPAAIEQLMLQVNHLQQLLQEKQTSSPIPSGDELLDVPQAAALLKLKVQTIYGLVREKKIPHFKKGKALYFSKQELLDWVKSGRRFTQEELDATAKAFLSSNRQRK